MSEERADLHVHLGERLDQSFIEEAKLNCVTVLGVLDREIVRSKRIAQLSAIAKLEGITVLPGVETSTGIPYDHQIAPIEILSLDFDPNDPQIRYYFDPQAEFYAPRHTHKVRFQSEYLRQQGLQLKETPDNASDWTRVKSGLFIDTAIRLCKIAATDPENHAYFQDHQDELQAHLKERPQDTDLIEAKYLFWAHFRGGRPGYLGWQKEKALLLATGEIQPELDAPRLIDLFHNAGGVVVIPHPHFRHTVEGGLEEILRNAFDMGIDGVEGWDADLLDEDLAKASRSLGKLVLGGSGQDLDSYRNRVMGKGDIRYQRMFIPAIILKEIKSYKVKAGLKDVS